MSSYNLTLNELIVKSRKHLLEMLQDRGFNTKKINSISDEELIKLFDKHKMDKMEASSSLGPLDISLKTPEGLKVIVKYRLDEKFKKSDKLHEQINEIFKKNKLNPETDCLIMMNIKRIYLKPGEKDNTVQTFVNKCLAEKKFVQFFGLENFMFNISKHIFVPRHIILKSNEVREMLTFYNTKLEHIPVIKREDQMAKYIGLRPGQVVKINSYNASTGISETYRRCVIE
jgi:DNA-directed RNA polymerase subunit H (RpoH/RPB5)